ncbi:MAG: hypothetical protein A3I11_03325 [Elusimicrobia bacterium RIFCSPLOWO2_02_FULL_39_32]|nr:MAG: hypothetical protein A3B80_01895 [Elusimicrobia bacterium RIFCSPHIGHO2_02_FULL_39_36]OGR92739.1 MAG: hypothetical protein A3I11_03325 [Elusimicrobia bacterium RIFCSPLOWO2_02_FULL_39_32]OGR99524.1 MAG: hypothetical protein A3G85_00680 [Elusimicrobia bacterium RIFCSPLOWO2_12_FULL_39_28]
MAAKFQKEILIPDTSLVVKWFIQEPDSELADRVLDEIIQEKWSLVAPELLRYELTHVFWKNRSRGFGEKDILQAFKELQNLSLKEVPLRSLFSMSVKMVFLYHITIYDAFFAALAKSLHGTLGTFDQELIKRLKKDSSIKILNFS